MYATSKITIFSTRSPYFSLMHDFKTNNRCYEGKHKEQSPKRKRLFENQDADNHGTHGSYAGPYGIGCAERDCFGGFGKEHHTQQTKNGESDVSHRLMESF